MPLDIKPLDVKKYQHTVCDVLAKTLEVLDTSIDNPWVAIGSAPVITELGAVVIEILFDPHDTKGDQ